MRGFKQFMKDDSAVAAIEAGLLFPLLVMILCGTIDLGMMLLTSQKVVNAAQTISDLMTRGTQVSDTDINDAIMAGQMALMPYSTTSYGVDIVGIQFIGTTLVPTVEWRKTQNMGINNNVLAKSDGMGAQDEGIVAVTVNYTFTPIFTSVVTGPMKMKEESYARGRKGLFVAKV
ncbi:MAG: pilus assembly protein [Micavibrio sp.]|nr:pilus assembly protein [Micavibrio sp.]